MNTVKVYHYDAFSKEPNKGNPAGVVLNGDTLEEREMQQIALKVGFNETAFAIKSNVADLRIRFFSPGVEMNLCGHATIATIFALQERGLLKNKQVLTIETKAGILPIKINPSSEGDVFITMKQATPKFHKYTGSKEALAKSIGISVADFHEELPILYGSTGNWTLLVPIKRLHAFKNMNPNNKLFPEILTEIPSASVHPFCLETYNMNTHMHARHFCSPYSGTIEDPVTGTASGVMGAYYVQYIEHNFDHSLQILVDQGYEMGKNGQVMVQVAKNMETLEVAISGTAVYVNELDISVEI